MFIKKIPLKIIMALAAVILIGAGTLFFYQQIKIVPEDLLKEALKNTLQAESYSYKIQSTLYVEGKKRLLSDIKGRKDAKDNYHLQGTMLKQPVEVYQIGETTYFKEDNNDQWMVMKNNNIMEMEQFITEVNPLSNFDFVVPDQVEYHGKEKLNKKAYHVLSCIPNVENHILKRHWKNFQYKFWVDKRGKIITKSLVTSEGSNNTILELLVELSNLNSSSDIKAPEISNEDTKE